LKECAKLMRHQRDNIRFYWSDQSTAEQALASGEIVAAYAWNDAVARLKKQGIPVNYMNPKEGMRTWVCGLVLMKDLAHEDLAYDFINAFTSPEAGQYLVQTLGTGHANKKAFDQIDPKVLDSLGITNPSALMEKTVFLRAVPEDRRKKYVSLFNTIKSGG
jgi:spermidine/putrescine transport system substrate-binding protein